MKLTFEVDKCYSYLPGKAIKRDMQRRWKETIYMCERGYGKDFFSKQIDELADTLIQYYQQTTWLMEL